MGKNYLYGCAQRASCTLFQMFASRLCLRVNQPLLIPRVNHALPTHLVVYQLNTNSLLAKCCNVRHRNRCQVNKLFIGRATRICQQAVYWLAPGNCRTTLRVRKQKISLRTQANVRHLCVKSFPEEKGSKSLRNDTYLSFV